MVDSSYDAIITKQHSIFSVVGIDLVSVLDQLLKALHYTKILCIVPPFHP